MAGKRKLKTPFADVLPGLSSEEFEALKADIKAAGVRDPVIVDEEGNVLDGHHRLRIDPKCKTAVVSGLSEDEKIAFVVRSNLCRRNLSSTQIRELENETLIPLANRLSWGPEHNQPPKERVKRLLKQAEVGALLGRSQPWVSKWTTPINGGEGMRNITRDIAHILSPVRATEKLPPVAYPEVMRRLEEGETQQRVAFDFKVDQGTIARVKAKEEKKAQKKREQAAAKRERKGAVAKGELWSFQVGDCRELPFENDSFDLVFCSPPYESQRDYGDLKFSLSGEEWVAWAVECFGECLRVCRGLVAWVVEGRTVKFDYSAVPFLLLADLKRAGIKLRKPCVYRRIGIPGTGGPDWLRNDWEPIVCAAKAGRLPWSDQTAMGNPPKQNKPRPATNRRRDGERKDLEYVDPEIANPGNVIAGTVGQGGMGNQLAHESEAPFPEWLVEFFVRSFCPPGGRILDPFSGSGTTVAVAARLGRCGVGVDVRQSQVDLGEARLLNWEIQKNA